MNKKRGASRFWVESFFGLEPYAGAVAQIWGNEIGNEIFCEVPIWDKNLASGTLFPGGK